MSIFAETNIAKKKDMTTPPVKPNKSTSVFSWLGFGLAIALFLLIWFVNILMFNWGGVLFNPIAPLFMLTFMLGGVLGLLALSFSIVGLVMAIKNNTPKWIGVTGIVLCIISFFSFIIPILCAGAINDNAEQVEIPEPEPSANEGISEDVTIQIFAIGRVRCLNNTDQENTVIGNLRTIDYDFQDQLSSWLKMNNVDSTTVVGVNSSSGADYSDITKVVETLKDNGISNIKLSSDL